VELTQGSTSIRKLNTVTTPTSGSETASHCGVLIVGGGFGGLYTARHLDHHQHSTTVIDRNPFQMFQPLLYQVATGQLPVSVVEFPFHELRNCTAVTGEAVSVDLDSNTVTLRDGSRHSGDYLVLATGAKVNFFGVTGTAENAHPMYTTADARAIKARLDELIESRRHFDVAVIGAGPTGVETTGAICDLIDISLPRTDPSFARESVTVHLIDHAQEPLSHFSKESQSYAHSVLESSAVQMHFGVRVTDVGTTSVTLDSGDTIPADLVIWAGGLQAQHPELTPTPTIGHGGRIEIDATLRIPGHPSVYCIGDTSVDEKQGLPQLGSVAKQQGIHVGESIRAQLKGIEPKPFAYKDLGEMAMVRRDHAVVEAGSGHHQVDGGAAYVMWLGLHATLLPDHHDRLEAVNDWIHETMTGRSRYIGVTDASGAKSSTASDN
jgi:NADH:ubiquinone reductase (H+-translocating)